MRINTGEFISQLLLCLIAAGIGTWGIGWGRPSQERLNLFLEPSLRTPEFYSDLERTRAERYTKIGDNPAAYAGRLLRDGKLFDQPADLRNSYSSFILRSYEPDEQATLVNLSRLDPLKGKWYPGTYHYLGAYIYPLALFMGASHAAGFVRLVSQPAFYYAHPEEMAKIHLMLHLWSVVGLLFGALTFFNLAKYLSSVRVAFWASVFYILSPAIMAYSKVGKPHIWAPGWTFLSLHFSFSFQESGKRRDLILSGIFMGCALSSLTTQVLFLPFLLWSCFQGSVHAFPKRVLCVLLPAATMFLLLNPAALFHLQDYADEIRFLSAWYPFQVRWQAVWDYFNYIIRPSLGLPLFSAACAGLVYGSVRPDAKVKRNLIFILMISLVIVAFQVQKSSQDPQQIRPWLAGLGLFVFVGVWFTFQFRVGLIIRWACLVVMLAYGIIYDMHFQSDVVSVNNASLASIWIARNIPPGETIVHKASIPHLDSCPPFHFSKYKLVPLEQAAGLSKRPIFFVADGQNGDAREWSAKHGYTLLKRFAESPLQRLGYQDVFTHANSVFEIYRKDAM